MANNQEIQDIITQSSKQSLIDAQKNAELLNKSLQETIVLRAKLNDTMVGAKTMGDLNKIAILEQQALEKTNAIIAKRQLAEEKLATFKATQQAKQDAIEAKQLKADNDRIARIKRIEEVEAARASKQAKIDENEVNAQRSINETQANAATALGSVTKAETGKTKAKKLSNLEQEKANQLAKIDRANLVAQAKEGIAVKGSLEQRQLALARLQKTYSLLTLEERNSPFGQRLAKTIPQLNAQVLTLESSLGKSQRNVGNYGNAFTKAFGVIRTAANILPGIGIAGIFGLILTPLIDIISKLDLFKQKAVDAVKAVAGTSSEFTGAVADINSLKTSISEFQSGLISKTELVTRYNEGIGKTVGELKTVEQVEAFYNSKAGVFVEAMFLRAQAAAALQKATEDVGKAMERATGGTTFSDNFAGFFANLPEVIGNTFEDIRSTISNPFDGRTNIKGLQNSYNIITQFARKAQAQATRDLQKQAKTGFQLFDDLQKQADAFAKKNGINFRTPTPTKTDKSAEKDARDSAAALVQIELNAAKEIEAIYKAQTDNVNFSLESRLEALKNFSAEQRNIAELEAKKDLVGKKNTADEEKLIKETLANKLTAIDRQTAQTSLDITKQAMTERQRIIAEQNAKDLTATEKQRDDELALLADAYNSADSLMSLESYNRKRLAIEQKYTLEYARLQIEQTAEFIKQAKLRGEDVGDAEAKLAALRIKYQDQVTANNKANADAIIADGDRELEARKVATEKAIDMAREAFDITRGLTTGIFEGNIQQLELEREAKDRQKQLDIENVNESTLNEKQQKEEIALINAKARQQEEASDAKIREQKRKQAIADKAFALSQIAINTAIAVSKVAAQTGIFALAGIGPIIALGALQAAAVLAQPIPKFAKGGTMQKDGLAEYGHGTELRINPDGQTSLTSSTPEIGFVQKGTKFISAPETKRLMAKPDSIDVGGKSWDVSGLIAESQLSRKEMKKLMGKIAIKTTNITEKGFSKNSQRMSSYKNYINKNFGR